MAIPPDRAEILARDARFYAQPLAIKIRKVSRKGLALR
jgi:hypothetical protein